MAHESFELSESLENYLAAIAVITYENSFAHVQDIAKMLGVKKSSVTNALKQLSGKGLIEYKSYMPIKLTSIGNKVATNLMQKHNAVRDFFVKLLSIPEKEADSMACKLEHSIGKTVTRRILEFMEFVDNCPRTANNLIKSNIGFICNKDMQTDICKSCIKDTIKSF